MPERRAAEPPVLIEHTVTHYWIVSDHLGGIRFSRSTRDTSRAAEEIAAAYEHYGAGCHIEKWEETWLSTPSTRTLIDENWKPPE